MNKVNIVGRITKSPELKATTSGVNVTHVTLAVNRKYAKEGEQSADFIPVVAFNKIAELINKYLDKGSQVAITGRLQTRSYEGQDGTKKYMMEVIADELDFCGSSKKKDEASDFITIEDNELPF